MRKLILCSAILMLAGCITMEPQSIGRDTYSVETMGTLYSGPGLRKATAFCTAQGKKMRLLTESSRGIGPGAEASLTFMCLDENDPRYTTPVLRKDNGVTTIENR